MTTALEIVTAAQRKIGVVAEDETPTADQSANGLDALNRMMHAWALAGADTTHVTLALSDTFPLTARFEEGTIYLLASRLSPDYRAPATFDADDWFRKIQAAYTTITAATIPQALLKTPSQRRYLEE